jgi:osmotically-inducible protein OsmY
MIKTRNALPKARIESPEEAALSKAVKARLAAEKTVNLTSVEVETNSGTVYLSGVVASLAARELALKLAWEVRGVQTVINHLEVEK